MWWGRILYAKGRVGEWVVEMGWGWRKGWQKGGLMQKTNGHEQDAALSRRDICVQIPVMPGAEDSPSLASVECVAEFVMS